MNDIEYDKLIEPPVVFNLDFVKVKPLFNHVLIVRLNLNLKRAQHLVDKFLWIGLILPIDDALPFLDLHFLDLILIIILKQLRRVKDLGAHLLVLDVEFKQIYIMRLFIILV